MRLIMMAKSTFFLLIVYSLFTGHLLAQDSEFLTKKINNTNLFSSGKKNSLIIINNEKLVSEIKYSDEIFYNDPYFEQDYKTDLDKQTLIYLNRQLERSRSITNVGVSAASASLVVLVIDIVGLITYGNAPFQDMIGEELYYPLIGGLAGGGAIMAYYGIFRARYYNNRINELQRKLSNSSLFIIPPQLQNFSNNYNSSYKFGLGIRITI